MGANLFKDSFKSQNPEMEKASYSKSMEFISHAVIDEKFNKIYLLSRNELQSITRDPSEEMLTNISHFLKKNSKFLENCFQDALISRSDIADMIVDRLSHDVGDYKVPSMESKHIESYIRSGHIYEGQQP